jgi:hypothetical protein
MVPLRYTEGGVLARRGHTEAATGKLHSVRCFLAVEPSIQTQPQRLRMNKKLTSPNWPLLVLILSLSLGRPLQTDQPPRRRSLMRDRQARRPIRIHGEAGRLQGVCSTVGVQDDQYRPVAGLYGEAEEGGAGIMRGVD